MPNGTVKFFNAKKGFGFITSDESNQEIFLPAASLTTSGLTNVVAGQRVTFETQADKKGPKAVEIALIAGAPIVAPPPRPAPVQAAAQQPRTERKPLVTLYHNPDSDVSCAALEDLQAAGIEPHVIDYIATPPTVDELRKLSLLLRESDQTLVRKYDTLFLELRLDDRFISEGEFWSAIMEHPTLINGPIIATASKANVCRTEQAVQAFIASLTSQNGAVLAEPKALPSRLLQLMAGTAAPRVAPTPVAAPVEEIEEPAPKAGPRILEATTREPAPMPAAPSSSRTLSLKPKTAEAPARIEAPAPVKEKAKAAPAKAEKVAKPKAVAKAKAPAAKKPAAKPVKKAVKKK